MRILGIDIGVTGAICMLGDDSPRIRDMPVHEIKVGRRNQLQVSAALLADIIESCSPVQHAFIEQQHPRPAQGVVSVFSLGRSFGVVVGTLAARGGAMTLVAPNEWTRWHKLKKGKDSHRQRAVEWYPGQAAILARARDDGRADALLIAHYGLHNTR